jgi:hypothetical protein
MLKLSNLSEKDLHWTYRRVGKSFKGQLEGLFLILNKSGRARNYSQTPPEQQGGKANGVASGDNRG